jgi:pyruvate kinase
VKQQLKPSGSGYSKMTQIIEAVENSPLIQVPQNTPQIKTKRFITKTICRHAAVMANAIEAKAIS